MSVVPGLYSEVARHSLRQRMGAWRFEPRPESAGTVCALYTVHYRISRM